MVETHAALERVSAKNAKVCELARFLAKSRVVQPHVLTLVNIDRAFHAHKESGVSLGVQEDTGGKHSPVIETKASVEEEDGKTQLPAE